MKALKKFFSSTAGKIILSVIALIPALIALALAIYYIVGPGEGYLHSDCTDSMYWANASYESGKVFDGSYRYAALLPFAANLWMQPLIAVFGFGMKAHNIGMIIFAVLFACAIFFCCRSAKMGIGWSSIAVFAVFMILSSSDKLREILWGHVIYYSLSLLFVCWLLGWAMRVLEPEYRYGEDGNKRMLIADVIFCAVMFTLVCCGAATDGFQVIAISSLPVAAAVAAERLFSGKEKLNDKKNINALLICVLFCAATLAGLLLLSSFQGKISYVYEYDAAEGYYISSTTDGVTPEGEQKEFRLSSSGKVDAEIYSADNIKTFALNRAGLTEAAAGNVSVRLCRDDDLEKLVYIVSFTGKKITCGYANAYSGWSDMSKWVENAESFVKNYLTLLGIPTAMGDNLFSKDSILSLIRIAAGLLILAVPVVMLFLYRKIRTRGTRLILWSYWVVDAVIMLGFICGKLSTANWRLTPVVGLAVLTTVAGIREAFVALAAAHAEGHDKDEDDVCAGRVAARVGALILAVVLFSSALTAKEIKTMPADYKRDNVYHKVADFLEEKDLEYGYATFWYSQVITMLSDSRAKTCEIMTSNSKGVYTDYYQSSRRWYADDTHDKYFVLLTNAEYETVKNTPSWLQWTNDWLLDSYEGVGGYAVKIFVFSQNVLAEYGEK